MKKIKMGIVLSALALTTVVLASCGENDEKTTKESKSSTNAVTTTALKENSIEEAFKLTKNFDLKKPELKKDAKQVTEEELDQYGNTHDADENKTKFDAFKNDFHSMSTALKKHYINGTKEEYTYIKTIYEFTTNSMWQFQRYEEIKGNKKTVSEYETKLVYVDYRYILQCDCSLNDYTYVVKGGDKFVKKIANGNLKFSFAVNAKKLPQDKDETYNALYESVRYSVFELNDAFTETNYSGMFKDIDYYLDEKNETVYENLGAVNGFGIATPFSTTYYFETKKDNALQEIYEETYYSNDDVLSNVNFTLDEEGYTSVAFLKNEKIPFFNPFFNKDFELREYYASLKTNEFQEFNSFVEEYFTCTEEELF